MRTRRWLFGVLVALMLVSGMAGPAGAADRSAGSSGEFAHSGLWSTGRLNILNGGGILQGSVRCTLSWEANDNYSTMFDYMTCWMTDSRRDGFGIWLSVDRRKSSSDPWSPFMTRSTCRNSSGSGTTARCSNWDFALAMSYQLRIKFGLKDGNTVVSTVTRTYTGIPGGRP